MSGAVWWTESHAVKGYLGLAPRDGLEWERHGSFCDPGFWRVSVTGWGGMTSRAVVDDFGDLVQIKEQRQ